MAPTASAEPSPNTNKVDSRPATCASTWATSALDGRWCGCLSMHAVQSSASSGGRPSIGGSGAGSVHMCAAISSLLVLACHGCAPVSIR